LASDPVPCWSSRRRPDDWSPLPVEAAWGILDLGEPVDTFLERTRGR